MLVIFFFFLKFLFPPLCLSIRKEWLEKMQNSTHNLESGTVTGNPPAFHDLQLLVGILFTAKMERKRKTRNPFDWRWGSAIKGGRFVVVGQSFLPSFPASHLPIGKPAVPHPLNKKMHSHQEDGILTKHLMCAHTGHTFSTGQCISGPMNTFPEHLGGTWIPVDEKLLYPKVNVFRDVVGFHLKSVSKIRAVLPSNALNLGLGKGKFLVMEFREPTTVVLFTEQEPHSVHILKR